MTGKWEAELPSECFFSLDLTTVQKASQLLYGESTSGAPEGLSKTVININNTIQKYGKCPKMLYTNIYDKMTYATVQTQIRMRSSLIRVFTVCHSTKYCKKLMHKKQNLGQKVWNKEFKILGH